MPEAVIPVVAEGAIGATSAEILAAQQAAAAAEAAQAAQAAQAATNSSVLNTITTTPVSTAAGAGAGTGAGAGGAGGISSLVNTTGGPTTFEQIFSQGQKIAEGSTELGKLASTASELPALPEAVTGPVTGPATSAPVQTAPLPSTTVPPVAPTAPTAPPVSDIISRSQGFIDTTARMANPGFDTGGFDGIQALAREVGAQPPAMPGVSPAITQYAPGAPVSSALPPALPSPVANAPVPIEQDPYNFFNNPKVNPDSSSFVGPRPEDTLDRQLREAGIKSAPAALPIEPGGQSLYGPEGIATGNPSPPPNTPTDVTYGAGQSRVTTNPADLLNQPTPASDLMSGIKGLYNDFKAMPLKDKALTGLMASSAYQMLNQPKPYEPKKYKSTWNAGAYSGYNPTPPTPYTPQYAGGGLADLGGYSDGGRMLKGPGDGMSDDIPATIANKQPARLANEEFVIPADVVSHLGNGSSEAGAKQLYKMMDRVRQARTGTKKQGKQINPEKYLA